MSTHNNTYTFCDNFYSSFHPPPENFRLPIFFRCFHKFIPLFLPHHPGNFYLSRRHPKSFVLIQYPLNCDVIIYYKLLCNRILYLGMFILHYLNSICNRQFLQCWHCIKFFVLFFLLQSRKIPGAVWLFSCLSICLLCMPLPYRQIFSQPLLLFCNIPLQYNPHTYR